MKEVKSKVRRDKGGLRLCEKGEGKEEGKVLGKTR